MKCLFLFLLPVLLFSKPHGAVTIAGDAHITQPDSKITEIRTSARAIIQWQDFSIEAGECTKFIQPGKHAAVLNRVSGNVTSRIDGLLQANGKVYLLNPNGILIGKEGVIQTGEFIGSTLDVLDDAFFKNKELLFQGASTASFINYGTIQAADGDVALFAKTVFNHGRIQAQQGEVNLVAAREIVLRPEGEDRIFIVASSNEKTEEGVENTGLIQAVRAHLMAEGNAYGLAICQTGEIEATGMLEREGRIYLVADQGIQKVSGKLAAKSGKIKISGKEIGLVETAQLDVSGDNGGGEIVIGETGTTELAVIEKNTTFDASAKIKGNGGRVIIWSEKAAAFAGHIQAEGGRESGDGGFVEVSGKEHLHFVGLVSTKAFNGKMGTLLLDPTDVTISAAADSNNTFSAGNYTYTAGTSNINITTLQTNLGATNVIISTNSPFAAPLGGTITLNGAVTWASASNLSLIATNNIVLNQGLTNTNIGSISLLAQNNIIMNGAPVAMAAPTLETVGGGISLQTLAGSILMQPTATNAVFIFPQFGGLTINAAQDMQLLGGAGANQFVELFASVGPNTISIGRDLIMTAGSGNSSFVQIAVPPNSPSTLPIFVGRNVQVTGGSGAAGQNFAVIGGSAGSVMTPAILANIALSTNGNVSITGGSGLNAFAQIGHFPSSTSAITEVAANVSVAVSGGLTLTGGSGTNNSAILGNGSVNSGLPAETISGAVSVAAGSISLTGGSAAGAIAEIGFVSSATSSTVQPAQVNVASLSNISIVGGTADLAAIGYIAEASATTLNSIVSVNVNAQGTLQMEAPSAGQALITNHRVGIQAPANVNIHFMNGLFGTLAGTAGNVRLYSSQDLVVIADVNMHLGNISNISSVAGQISLVVDNEFSSEAGPGQFIKDLGATITTTGPVRIFTAERTQNSIQGLINGAAFVPGPLFIDSATERWGVHFFNPFGGFPFTIFYKDELPAYQNAYGIAISEALRDLRIYDELIFVRIPFFLCYDRENYFRPRGALSGYDFAEDEEYDMLRQRYRNYNTKYSESL